MTESRLNLRRPLGLATRLASVFVCAALSVAQVGCDDAEKAAETEAKAKADKEAKEAAEREALAAIAAASAAKKAEEEAAAAAKKPAKTLADCGDELEISEEMEGPIRLKAQKADGTITVSDLKKLRSLNLSRVSLDELDICLFRHMTELRELFLGQGQVSDLTPIAGASKLESLRVSMNPVVDLSPLEKMTKMDRLDLGKTMVTDLSPLKGMTKMTELMLDSTPVEDVSALAGMTLLEKLSVAKTKVSDISALADLKKLEFLYIGESPLSSNISATGVVAKNGTKVLSE
jgi:internalin A